MTLQGTKNLENWCKHVTEGKVNVVNMSTSWRNGLGFCAIIHHFRPDLIDFDNLDPDDVYGNNELAFRVAEAHLGIPALLDPADMLECSIPDRLSILTYLSQFYHAFHSANLKNKKIGGGGSQTSSEASTPSKSSSSTTATMLRSRAKESCHFCQKPVFILERINVAGHLLHRTCFKCRRCDTQLSIVNFYETEAGEFCCDMCPDEEKNHVEVTSANKKIVEDWSGSGGSGEEEPKTTPMNVTDEDRAQNNETSVTEATINDNNNDNDNDNNNSKENLENNNSGVDNNNSVLPENSTEDVGDSIPDNQVTKVVPDEIAVAVVLEKVMAHEVINSVESLSKTDDERLVAHSDQQVKDSADAHLSESSDEELHEKNESEKSEKEEKLPEELVVTESENVEAKTDDIKSVEASSKVDRDNETPEMNEKEKSANHQDDKDVCDAIEEEIYPDDLNPFGDEEEKKVDEEIRIVSSSNPFGSDDEDEGELRTSPMSPNSIALSAKGTPLVGPPKPPRISLNPFGSDFEDDDEEANNDVTPKLSRVPKPPPSPTLSCASGTSVRKKRHAPPPPKAALPIPSPRTSLKTSTPGAELRRSAPPRPPPPVATPTQPKERKEIENLNRRSQQLLETSIDSKTVDSTKSKDTKLTEAKPDDAKLTTNDSKMNEIKSRDKAVLPSEIVLTQLPPNKASEGVWKKKKGPAPPRPIPPKLQVKKLPRKAVNQELHDIEVKQQELERQGVKLEKTIRELCEKSDSERLEKGLDNNDRDSLGPEAEDLIMQLFELVNEKNDLYRRQTELMYMKREHRLEEEHADIEYQIRVLMSKAETLRTDDEKLKEEKLISRLMEIVAQRNEIVDCLEMDRLRELEEDESIEVHMGEFAAVRPPEGEEKTKKKKKEKEKKKKKKDKVHDDDKDIDTSENGGATPKSSPKKGSLGSGGEKDLAKKMKKKIMSTLKPVVLNKKST